MFPTICIVRSRRKRLSPVCRSPTSCSPKFASLPNAPPWSSFASGCVAVLPWCSPFRPPRRSAESATQDDRSGCLGCDRIPFWLVNGTQNRPAYLAALRISSLPSSAGPGSNSGIAPLSSAKKPSPAIAPKSRSMISPICRCIVILTIFCSLAFGIFAPI